MSLLRTHVAILRRGGARSTVLLRMTAIAALVVGLLAMHTFMSSMGNHDEPAAAMGAATMAAASMGAATMAADVTVHSDFAGGDLVADGNHVAALTVCSATCDLGHSMAGMACVLALLFTALSLAAATAANVTAFGPRARQALSRMIAFAAAQADPPPDLNALSISRT